jgi:hypothetical protein
MYVSACGAHGSSEAQRSNNTRADLQVGDRDRAAQSQAARVHAYGDTEQTTLFCALAC